MEQEILAELSAIKILLWVNLAVIVLCAGYILTRRVIANLSTLDTFKREQFISVSQAHDDKGEYEELMEFAQTRIDKYPKDPLAWWYLGLSQYKTGSYAKALNSFSELRAIDATYYSEAVVEYIDEIRGLMNGPKGNNA